MIVKQNQELFIEADRFITLCYTELGKSHEETRTRIHAIEKSIQESGKYVHTFEELEHGAKMAWRNSNRCIGRLFWDKLHVLDKRELSTAEEIATALFDHISYATNEGNILPTISIFKPRNNGKDQVRIWNHQLIRYAGYETGNGTIGDPHSVGFTNVCRKLGWNGDGTRFDLLPLVIQTSGQPPTLFALPKDLVLEVPIIHPTLEAFGSLELQWYALPLISDMLLEIGGIQYSAAPFNGWYMGTEIGARNLADVDRYNQLPEVARLLGLATERESTLWRDKALVELNVAVLHSFKQAGVSIVDHHTAAHQFQLFEKREKEKNRDLTGDWTWLIPPVSPATTHIFHQTYEDRVVTPNYYYQAKPY